MVEIIQGKKKLEKPIFTIVKMDEATHTVSGVAASEDPDGDGEIWDYEYGKEQMQKWSDDCYRQTTAAGQDPSRGNMRIMHDVAADALGGKVLSINFDDVKKEAWIDTEPVDESVWQKIKRGILRGFSIGGSYAWKKEEKGAGGKTYTRYGANISEISYVDAPCNPKAVVTMVKVDGSQEVMKFQADGLNKAILDAKNIAVKTAKDFLAAMEDMEKVRTPLGQYTVQNTGDGHDFLVASGYAQDRAGVTAAVGGAPTADVPHSVYKNPNGQSIAVHGDGSWEHNDGHERRTTGPNLTSLQAFIQTSKTEGDSMTKEHLENLVKALPFGLTVEQLEVMAKGETPVFTIGQELAMSKFNPDQGRDKDGSGGGGESLGAKADAATARANSSGSKEDHEAAAQAHFATAKDLREYATKQPIGIKYAIKEMADSHYVAGRLHEDAARGAYSKPISRKAEQDSLHKIDAELAMLKFNPDPAHGKDGKFTSGEASEDAHTKSDTAEQNDGSSKESLIADHQAAADAHTAAAKLHQKDAKTEEKNGNQEAADSHKAAAREHKEQASYHRSVIRYVNKPDDSKRDFALAAKAAGDAEEDAKERLEEEIEEDESGEAENDLEKKTKSVDGEDLPASAFLIVLDPDNTATWNLPVHFKDAAATESHIRNALARFDQLKDVPEEAKEKAWSKLTALAREYNIGDTAEKVLGKAYQQLTVGDWLGLLESFPATPALTKAEISQQGVIDSMKSIEELVKAAKGLAGHFGKAAAHHMKMAEVHKAQAETHEGMAECHKGMGEACKAAAANDLNKGLHGHHTEMHKLHKASAGHSMEMHKMHKAMGEHCAAMGDSMKEDTEKAEKAIGTDESSLLKAITDLSTAMTTAIGEVKTEVAAAKTEMPTLVKTQLEDLAKNTLDPMFAKGMGAKPLPGGQLIARDGKEVSIEGVSQTESGI